MRKNRVFEKTLVSIRRFGKKCAFRKVLLISVLVTNCLLFSSCSPYIWMAIASGLMSTPTNQMYYTPSYYPSTVSSSPSSSSSVTGSTCSRCRGTGSCQSCGGTGRKYDYGPMSVISDEKYEYRCGVCNGTGKCGVCDGKGHH